MNEFDIVTLPVGWTQATVGDTGQYINGLGFKESDWGDVGLPIIRIQNLTDQRKPFNRTTRRVEGSFLVERGDILVSWSATLDAFIWDREQSVLNQHIFKVVPDERLTSRRFLFYLLRQAIAEMKQSAHLHGSTMKHINRGPFLGFSVPIPPLPEQHRIVAEIETQLTRLDAAVAALERARANLKRYRAAVLKAACEGRLVATESEVAFEPGSDGAQVDALPPSWRWVTLGTVRTEIKAGKSFKCNERPPSVDEVGVVKVSAVTWGEYDEAETKTCIDPDRVDSSLFVETGDFLFSRANTIDLVGACVIAKRVTKRVMLSDKILRFGFEGVERRWVLYCLRSRWGRSEIERLATGNQESMRNIGQDRIRQIRIPLPPLAEQRRIVAEVERRLSVVNAMEQTVGRGLARAARLRQAVLRKAFAGELVPQDPGDEPASVLLERIRAERAANPAAGKRRNTGRGRQSRSGKAVQASLSLSDATATPGPR